ncbi:hypothetical protein [Pseudomonas baetica]|uniref:hypothetical protein n=1 Tax=Pseudomonas baetica TaxID=674054 RepID=UPI0024051B17|nr:hypothetical protein [Pseudomonas baetica]MDF9778797.1 hypothetical protein [Pseudomonas baetica]
MLASTPHSEGAVQIGRFSFTHNRFLVLLGCLAALAFVLADSFGFPINNIGGTGFSKLATPQMIWALLLIPVAIFGAWALKRAGHRDTALSCVLLAVSFLAGVLIKIFWM